MPRSSLPIFDTLRNWLFRWHSDGAATIVLNQRRIFIIPTRAGVLYAIAQILMLLGAINYSLGLGHALVFLLAGLGLTGMVHTFRNLYALQIAPVRAEAAFAGEIAHFQLHLVNDRARARLALEFRAADNPVVRCDLPAHGYADIALPVITERRGWMKLPRVRLETTYPLGLFVAWSYPWPEMRCLVYPRPITLPLPPPSNSEHAGSRLGDGGEDDFFGLRERQPADSPRHIAWKAAARDENQPLQIKQFAGGAQTELWLDWRLLPGELGHEDKLSVMTGWVLQAEAACCRYGLRLPTDTLPLADGPSHRDACLERLALAE